MISAATGMIRGPLDLRKGFSVKASVVRFELYALTTDDWQHLVPHGHTVTSDPKSQATRLSLSDVIDNYKVYKLTI